jgi:uncharacterized protein YggU (UPF0235/DUF167 family)
VVAVSRAPDDGVRVAVRVRPGSRRDAGLDVADRISLTLDGPSGVLDAVRVHEEFGVRRGDVELLSGARGRDKIVAVRGDQTRITARLAELLA